MKKLVLGLALFVGVSSARAADIVYVPEMANDAVAGRNVIESLYTAVAVQGPAPTAVGQVVGNNFNWTAKTQPNVSKSTLLQIVTSSRCATQVPGGHGCLVAENKGITSFYVTQQGSVKTLWQTTFNDAGSYLSKIADRVVGGRVAPTIYVWQKTKDDNTSWWGSHGWCDLNADLDAKTAVYVGISIIPRNLSGTGQLACFHFDGSVERLPVNITASGWGVGLGVTFGTKIHLLSSGTGFTQGITELLGDYYLVHGHVNILVAGVGVGTGLHFSKGSVVLPLYAYVQTAVGLEGAIDFQKATLTPAGDIERTNAKGEKTYVSVR